MWQVAARVSAVARALGTAALRHWLPVSRNCDRASGALTGRAGRVNGAMVRALTLFIFGRSSAAKASWSYSLCTGLERRLGCGVATLKPASASDRMSLMLSSHAKLAAAVACACAWMAWPWPLPVSALPPTHHEALSTRLSGLNAFPIIICS